MSIGKIISSLTDQQVILGDISRLKNQHNPASRVFNWGIITNCLKQLGFRLDAEIKSLIVSGDIELISDMLKDLYNHFK